MSLNVLNYILIKIWDNRTIFLVPQCPPFARFWEMVQFSKAAPGNPARCIKKAPKRGLFRRSRPMIPGRPIVLRGNDPEYPAGVPFPDLEFLTLALVEGPAYNILLRSSKTPGI